MFPGRLPRLCGIYDSSCESLLVCAAVFRNRANKHRSCPRAFAMFAVARVSKWKSEMVSDITNLIGVPLEGSRLLCPQKTSMLPWTALLDLSFRAPRKCQMVGLGEGIFQASFSVHQALDQEQPGSGTCLLRKGNGGMSSGLRGSARVQGSLAGDPFPSSRNDLL